MEILVRPIEPGEKKAVLKMGRRAFTGFESLWVTKPKEALVAVRDGKIVGAVLYKIFQAGGRKVGYYDYGFVDPSCHHQGIGRVLYRECANFLWAQGCDALTAVVKDDNVGSWGSLFNNGFVRISLPELVRQFGVGGMLRHYFGTPFCIGIGMEYYVALKDGDCPLGKEGSAKQIAGYLLANLLLVPIVLLHVSQNAGAFLLAYILCLAGSIFAGFIGTLFSKRRWQFRLNNGGGLTCALVSLGGVYPMVGNWYPDRYEKTLSFRRDMGINALAGWIFVMVLSVLPFFEIGSLIFIRYTGQIGAIFLLYRILAFYPFESFGGQRVWLWKKWVYVLMSALSIAVLVLRNGQ